jgi:GNAT superfamily N-acetyltransferase
MMSHDDRVKKVIGASRQWRGRFHWHSLRRQQGAVKLPMLNGTTRMQICQATTPEQIAMIRGLFQDYAAWFRIDLCYQGFAEELKSLPGYYAPPRGRLLLATGTNGSTGCGAVRPLGDTVCEMKRLFVRPAYQGRGWGRALAQRAVSEARSIGYSTMRLDTLPFMHGAMRLYESLGFVRRSAYYDTPLQETVFMELQL